MAKLRDLKKDIDYLTSEIIAEAYTVSLLFPEVKEDKVDGVLQKAIQMNQEFISRVNHPNGKDNPKLVKQYFKQLHKDLLTAYNGLVDEVNTLTPKSK